MQAGTRLWDLRPGVQGRDTVGRRKDYCRKKEQDQVCDLVAGLGGSSAGRGAGHRAALSSEPCKMEDFERLVMGAPGGQLARVGGQSPKERSEHRSEGPSRCKDWNQTPRQWKEGHQGQPTEARSQRNIAKPLCREGGRPVRGACPGTAGRGVGNPVSVPYARPQGRLCANP